MKLAATLLLVCLGGALASDATLGHAFGGSVNVSHTELSTPDITLPQIKIPGKKLQIPRIDVALPQFQVPHVAVNLSGAADLAAALAHKVPHVAVNLSGMADAGAGAAAALASLASKVPKVNLDVNGSFDPSALLNKLPKFGLDVDLPTIKKADVLPKLDVNFTMPEMSKKDVKLGLSVPSMTMPKINITMPELVMKKLALNLSVPEFRGPQLKVKVDMPDITLPDLANKFNLNVQGAHPMASIGSQLSAALTGDQLKSATLLSWLKDAGFYVAKNVTADGGSLTVDLQKGVAAEAPAAVNATAAAEVPAVDAAAAAPAEEAPESTEGEAEVVAPGSRRLRF